MAIKELIKKQHKDTIDKQMLIKKFFKTIYRDIDLENEYIRVFQNNRESTYNKVNYFNNIDDLVNFSINKYNYYNNTYFELSTTDGAGGSEEHLKYRYCLGFDFDKKDLGADFNHKDIINLFKSIKMYCHCILDSGNGFHTFVMINKTNNLKMVDEVQKALAIKLNADLNAIKTTQILRVPFTFNVKSDKPKAVKLVHLEAYDSGLFKAYDIEFLHSKNCNNREIKADSKITNYTLNNTNVPKCLVKILEDGSNKGDRYKDLQNIVVALRLRNKSLSEIKEVVKEWALKSDYDDNLNYRIENIYNNKMSLELDCKNCIEFNSCYNKIVSDFEFKEDEKFIKVSETNMCKLKNTNRRGAKIMKSNDLLVYCVLKNHHDGLTREELLKELTYTKKKVVKNIALSERTLKDTLKSLEENGFIEVIKGNARQGIANIYKIKIERSKVDLTYNISYGATYECIKGNISTEELRLYNYMRYLHHKEQRENPTALRGNLFQINQIELAKELGVTQGRISVMVNNLLDEKLLSIWYRQPSKNNSFEYYIYRLNY